MMRLRQSMKILREYFTAGVRGDFGGALSLLGTRRGFRARRRWQKWRRNLQRQCDHKHWRSVREDGRCCTCGYVIFDPGD